MCHFAFDGHAQVFQQQEASPFVSVFDQGFRKLSTLLEVVSSCALSKDQKHSNSEAQWITILQTGRYHGG
jgi:hypothetical protein